tara:strand:- start:1283 stop:1876 length:594 start_codon:yes stop_codon:yes gene_type:complete
MDYNPFKRKISELSTLKAQKGRLLVAEPFMDDPYFKRSVVLLTEHNKDGSVGFILNQPMEIKLNELIEDFPEFNSQVFLGGPVQPQNLFYLHEKGDLIPESTEVSQNLFWNGNFGVLKGLIEQSLIQESDIKFFLGYSGWDKKQLEQELESDSWFVQNSNRKFVFEYQSDELWKKVMESAEKDIALMANFPEDPNLN